MRLIFVLLQGFFALSALSAPFEYVVVGISGFGTRRATENYWQPSGAHENLPNSYRIVETHKLVHYSKKKELLNALSLFDCKDGRQLNDDLGLIIIGNSWGASNTYKLSKLYKEECGRVARLVVMVDGVRKPIGSYKKRPFAKQCINYYQTTGFAHGRKLEDCENIDLTSYCKKRGKECHIEVEWLGTRDAKRFIERALKLEKL
ncbi:hypothetical protein HBN50_17370 [Halobacteriovorax sp. GB3]|uniref:hypothetical protein n=1 Tax=Halobacteriovorax sp. GB3 TaxID=2719615 RepID=UPI002362E95C|nr:hypothetical protein [Halobacteriovorax sp. GB3]MDD0854876.1 hypothetical protein [Halobacteriovorax sp. GB3]